MRDAGPEKARCIEMCVSYVRMLYGLVISMALIVIFFIGLCLPVA